MSSVLTNYINIINMLPLASISCYFYYLLIQQHLAKSENNIDNALNM